MHLQSKQRAERGQTIGSEGMYYKIHTILNYKLKNDILSKKEIRCLLVARHIDNIKNWLELGPKYVYSEVISHRL